MDLLVFFLILIVPGLIGSLAFYFAARWETKITWCTALILDLLTFTTMLIGLYFFKDIVNCHQLKTEFCCLSFTRNYILLSIWFNILYGVIFGLLRRLFFWVRHSSGC